MDIQGPAIEQIPESGNPGLVEEIFLISGGPATGTVIDMATRLGSDAGIVDFGGTVEFMTAAEVLEI